MKLRTFRISSSFVRLFLAALVVCGLLLALPPDAKAETVNSGTCGENLTWTLDDRGTLTISGEGAMTNFTSASRPPWYDGREYIYEIIVESGVTSIGERAFEDCNSLTGITIPEGVTQICNWAFYGCSSLTSVTIPVGVISIGDSAFENSSLTDITIHQGVSVIGDSAFSGCNLVEITIPQGVISIGDGAFYGCNSLVSITIPEGVTVIGDSTFSYCTSLTNVTIPKGVTSIGNSVFYYCVSLTSVTILEGVTSINAFAFYNCTSLISVTIPESVINIGYSAFFNCTNLTNVTIPDSVTTIDGSAFSFCSSLTSVTIPEGVTSINASVFRYCTSLTSVTIPEGVTSIGAYAFERCSNLTSVTIPEGVIDIANCAFSFCRSLKSVTIPGGVANIGGYAFENCISLTNVTISEGVNRIGYSTFINCNSLNKVTIPETVSCIGGYAFYNCSSLTGVTLPASVTYIEAYAFSHCTSLIDIIIPESVTSIGESAFSHCTGLTSVSILEGVDSIYGYAFYNCSSLTSVTIPERVSIGTYAFYNCSSVVDVFYASNESNWRWLGVHRPTATYVHYNCTNAENHWEVISTNPTCIKDGITYERCSCNYERNHKITNEASGHREIVDKAVAATCTVAGLTEGKHCEFCGKVLVAQKRVPALGHSYSNGTCQNCGDTYLANVTITSTVSHTSGIILYWDTVDGGDIYQIYRLASGESSWTLIKNTRSLGYKDESAEVGIKYYYKIVARNGDVKSDIKTTQSVSAVRPAATLANVVISKTVGHTTGNILYWDAVDGAKLYQVYRLDSGAWTLLKNTGSLAYKDEAAPVGVKSYYKIVARNGDIKSNIATTASTGVVRPAAAVTKLDNVTITQIKAHSSGNILYWNAVENAKVYQVYRLENGKWVLLKNTGSLGYKDETAPVGVKCYYKIVARNGDVKSDIATTVSASATRP